MWFCLAALEELWFWTVWFLCLNVHFFEFFLLGFHCASCLCVSH
jgi:hypothetical protein